MRQVRPISLMNLQAIIDPWGGSKGTALCVSCDEPRIYRTAPAIWQEMGGSSVSLRSGRGTSKIFPTSGTPTPDCPPSSASNLHCQCMSWCRRRT